MLTRICIRMCAHAHAYNNACRRNFLFACSRHCNQLLQLSLEHHHTSAYEDSPVYAVSTFSCCCCSSAVLACGHSISLLWHPQQCHWSSVRPCRCVCHAGLSLQHHLLVSLSPGPRPLPHPLPPSSVCLPAQVTATTQSCHQVCASVRSLYPLQNTVHKIVSIC